MPSTAFLTSCSVSSISNSPVVVIQQAGTLSLVGIRHILAAPYHPQTNGKVERYQQSLKREVNQLPYEFPSQLELAIIEFVDYYNYRRYHKALSNVTPADVLYGKKEEILKRRKKMQIQTINRCKDYNRDLRRLANAA